MKELIKEATTKDEAIKQGLAEMNLSEEEVSITVIRDEGLFDSACVKITKKQGKEEKALDFVENLINLMGLETAAELLETEDNCTINLQGKDNGIAIGHRGEALDAIQYLTTLYANSEGGDYLKVIIDAENYRNKRVKTLERLAKNLASKAVQKNAIIEVEPMNPYERKIIHSFLSDDDRVITESEGESPNRYVLIIPQIQQVVEEEVKPKKNFKKTGLGKVRRYGNKRR